MILIKFFFFITVLQKQDETIGESIAQNQNVIMGNDPKKRGRSNKNGIYLYRRCLSTRNGGGGTSEVSRRKEQSLSEEELTRSRSFVFLEMSIARLLS